MVEQIINPAAISGLLDPYIKQREQEQLGAGVGEAFSALQKEDYPRMARALQGIAGQSPQSALMLMNAMNQHQQRIQEDRRIKVLEEQAKERATYQAFEDAEGYKTLLRIDPHDKSVTVVQSANPTWPGNRGAAAAGGAPAAAQPVPSQAAPAAAAAPPPPPTAAPAAAAPAGGWPTPSPAQIQKLKDNPDKQAEFDAKFGPGAAAQVIPPAGGAPGAGPTTALPPVTVSGAAPAGAAPGVPGGLPSAAELVPTTLRTPGVPAALQRKELGTEGAKLALKDAQDNVKAARTAVTQLPNWTRALAIMERLNELGGIGPQMGPGHPFLHGVVRHTGGMFVNPEIIQLRDEYDRIRSALQGYASQGHKGEGAVSNFERELYAKPIPNYAETNPAAVLAALRQARQDVLTMHQMGLRSYQLLQGSGFGPQAQ